MPTSPADLSEFTAVNQRFQTEVGTNRNFAALAEIYTKNARILPPGGELITGVENISAFWQQAIDALHAESVELTTVELTPITADAAVEIGRAKIAVTGDPAGMLVNYVVFWKKEGGSWKWDIDIWNQAAA